MCVQGEEILSQASRAPTESDSEAEPVDEDDESEVVSVHLVVH